MQWHWHLLFFFLAGHALMDFALQPDPMAVCKCRRANHPLKAIVPWFYWLSSHALIHGGTVAVIVRWCGFDWNVAVVLGLAETLVHWFIDLGKCENWYGLAADQALHLICKIVWWLLLVAGTLSWIPPAG